MASKRPAASLAAKGAKKQKGADPLAQQCQDVLVGLRKAALVEPQVTSLLDDILPLALLVPRDQRHRFQHAVVEMSEQALVGNEGALKEAIQNATEALAGGKEALAVAEQHSAAKEAALTECTSATNDRKITLATIAKKYQVAKTHVAEAQAAEIIGNKELSAAEGKKAKLVSLVGKHLGPLKEGTAEEGQTKELVKDFLQGLQELGFDASLIVALPNVLEKAPSARSPFDTVVITQLEDEVAKKVAALQAVLDNGEAGKAQRTAAVKAAEDQLAEARKDQQAAAEAYLAAEALQKEAQAAVEEAHRAAKGAGATAKTLQKALDKAAKQLQDFHSGPLAAFLALRDRETPAPAVPEAEATAAGAGMEVEEAPEAAAAAQ